MKCRSDKEQFVRLLEDDEAFREMDEIEKELIRLTTNFRIPDQIEKGEQEVMCKAIEDLREEGREEGVMLTARRMLTKGLSVEEVSEYTGLTEQQVEKLIS